jgi:hypothetical protein
MRPGDGIVFFPNLVRKPFEYYERRAGIAGPVNLDSQPPRSVRRSSRLRLFRLRATATPATPATTVAAATPVTTAIRFFLRCASRPVTRSTTFRATTVACEPAFFADLIARRAVRTASAAVPTASVAVCSVTRADFPIPAILSSR